MQGRVEVRKVAADSPRVEHYTPQQSGSFKALRLLVTHSYTATILFPRPVGTLILTRVSVPVSQLSGHLHQIWVTGAL